LTVKLIIAYKVLKNIILKLYLLGKKQNKSSMILLKIQGFKISKCT